MSQISATPGITTTTLGQYIRKDGTTDPHTGRIPFSQGIQANASSGIGTSQANPFIGYHTGSAFRKTGFYWSSTGIEFTICGDDGNGNSKDLFFFDNTGVANWNIIAGTSILPAVDQAYSLGSSSFSWNSVTSQSFEARGSNPAYYLTRTGVDQWRINATSGGTFTIENVTDASRDAFAADGSGNVVLGAAALNTTVAGNFIVTSTTTLNTGLTGLLKATAGVVSTATAGTDYVHTLSVTPQILNLGTAADPNIAFDTTAAFNWSGGHEWSSGAELTIDENVKLHVGNNASSVGNLLLYYDAGGQEVGFYDESGYVGLGYKFIFDPALKVNTTQSQYSQFGAVPTLTVPSNTTTLLAAGQTFNGSLGSGTQAGIFESYFTGGANDAQAHSALVLNHYITGANTLTLATNEGGSNAAKINYRHAGTATISLATSLDITAAHTNTGNTTNLIGINIEVPSNSSTGKPGTWTGIKLPTAGSGFTTTAAYGIFIQTLKSAYPAWFDGGAECYFRESGCRISSSAAATLDINSTTTLNFNIGGATPFIFTAGQLTLANAVNIAVNTSTGTKIGTGTTQKIGFYNATPVIRAVATTDLGTVLSNIGIRAAGTAYPITTSGTVTFTGLVGSLRTNSSAVLGAYKPTLVRFTPLDNMPLAANYATLNTRNNHAVLEFDDTTAETAVFTGVLDRAYDSSGITITIVWAGKTATTGNVVWNAYIERMDTSTDIDADSFAAAQTATGAANGTSGIPTYTSITMTDGSQMDSLAIDEAFRLKIERDASNGSDTMTGDAQLLAVFIKAT